MAQDRRKHVRHQVSYSCWLGATGTAQLEGRVRNISEGGVKVVCRAQGDVPDTVDLYMTKDGKVIRRCKVVWRSEDALGLMFLPKANSPSPAGWWSRRRQQQSQIG